MDAMDSMRSCAPWGSEDAAARNSAELKEPRRVLPEIPMMLIGGMLVSVRPLGQVEHDHFRIPTAGERDVARARLERIPWPERVAIHVDVAAGHVHIAEPSVADGAFRARFAVEKPRVHEGILVHPERPLPAIWRDDEPQLPALLLRRKSLLLVRRRDAAHFGLDPDLQKMGLAIMRVVLRVPHAGARTHALHVAIRDGGSRAGGITMREGAFQHEIGRAHV